MTLEEIKEVIGQYAQVAKNAIEAGFDGVEIHGAHGYLIDQFTYEFANKRTDQYGGDLKQRLTFMKEVTEAVIEAVGAEKHFFASLLSKEITLLICGKIQNLRLKRS